ncbi:MAG: CDP-diacylglycerol--serine O-phosphatidyltransferase [Muribaculaceae bacterium]|nr:CDP-diacylglycerol--serine O-phosphatidyltransferase [Muribaculaceae bacterium]
MNLVRNNIPNFITSLNLLSGCLAVVAAFHVGETLCLGLTGLEWAFVLIAAAAVFDFFDGFAARLLHAVSGIGKELDSLSDLVSFGVAPAMIVFNVLQPQWVAWAAMLIAVCGALRLARFNVDTRQSTTFTGLPIPGNAIFWIGASAWLAAHPGTSPWLTLAVIVLVSWLMVSPLRMFSLKLHNLSPRENWAQLTLVVGAILLVCLLGIYGLAATIALYVVLSIIKHEK